jgi:hypothetical protein
MQLRSCQRKIRRVATRAFQLKSRVNTRSLSTITLKWRYVQHIPSGIPIEVVRKQEKFVGLLEPG